MAQSFGSCDSPLTRRFVYKVFFGLNFLGIKIMLSAKLAEGKLRIIDNEKMEDHKTKNINTILN